MAYRTYITEAIVCGSFNRNTASRLYLLFTREAGMIYAHAESVRKEISKQRFALQECAHVRVTLIKGRHEWKIAGAEALRSFYSACDTRYERAVLRDILLLLRRYIRGESPHPELYDEVVRIFSSLHTAKTPVFQKVAELRILFALGYVAPDALYEYLLVDEFPVDAITALSPTIQNAIHRSVENALMQSQL